MYIITINNVKAIKTTENILWKENIRNCVQNWYCSGNNHVKGKVYYEKNEEKQEYTRKYYGHLSKDEK